MITDKNYIELAGRLTKDLVIHATQKNKEYGIINLAINKYYKDPQNITGKQSSFFNVFIWHPGLLELYQGYLMKGVKVIVRGELANYDGKISINLTDKNGLSVLMGISPLKVMSDKSEVEEPNIAEAMLTHNEDNLSLN